MIAAKHLPLDYDFRLAVHANSRQVYLLRHSTEAMWEAYICRKVHPNITDMLGASFMSTFLLSVLQWLIHAVAVAFAVL